MPDPNQSHARNALEDDVSNVLTAAAFGTAGLSCAFTWSKATGLPWRVVLAVAAIALVASGVRTLVSPTHRRAAVLAFLGLVGLTVVRWIPLAGAIAPPGGDMSMHTLLARIALLHDVLPHEQLPFYEGVPYGAYPLGFHGLVAALASSGAGIVVASLVVTAWAHALFAAGVAVLLRRSFPLPIAIATALVGTFAVRNPQAYVGWGGNPCVLGFALLFFAFEAARRAFDEPTRWHVFRAAVLIAGTLAVHATAGAVLACALAVLALAHLRSRPTVRTAMPVAGVAVFAMALAIPVVRELLGTEFSAGELGWLRANHLKPPQSPPLTWSLLPDYWKYLGGDVALVLGAMGMLARLRSDRRDTLLSGAALLLLPYVVVAFRHSSLPGAEVAYPERVLLVLVVPWSRLVAGLIEALARGWSVRRARIAVRTSVGTIALAIAIASGVNAFEYAVRPARHPSVDDLDARAFDTLAAVAVPSTRVWNRGGDAAAFLPGIWGIVATNPQWNPIWMDELDAWRAERSADFAVWRGQRPDGLAGFEPWRTFADGPDTVSIAKRVD
jgi:hypothetical protein